MTYIIPKSTKFDVMKRDHFICVKCRSNKELTIDHIVPVSKGGTNDLDNLRTLCYDCNQTRGNFNPTFKEKLLSWVFTRREANTLRNELKDEVRMVTGDVRKKFESDLQSHKDKTEKRFQEIAPKIETWLKEYGKTQEIKNVGFDNTDTAARRDFEEGDMFLFKRICWVGERIEAMEKYLGIEFVETKEYRKKDE